MSLKFRPAPFMFLSPGQTDAQVDASWVTSVNLLLATDEIEDSLPCVSDLCVLARKLASPFGHPTQFSTQV